MGGYHALIEYRAALGVDAGGDIGGRYFPRRGAQLGGILRLGQGVQIDNAENALIIPLQHDPITYRPQVISEVKIAGGLNARKNTVHIASCEFSGALPLMPLRASGQTVCRCTPLTRSRQFAIPD